MLTAAMQIIFITSVCILFVGLVATQYYRDVTVDELDWIFTLIILTAIIVYIYPYLFRNKNQFRDVRDLIHGSIESEINDLKRVYEHFKQTPGIRIINVNEHFGTLDKAEVFFVYNE